MSISRLVRDFLVFFLIGFIFLSKTQAFGQVQDFEIDFEIKNHPEYFLPKWSGNEIRSTSSRIFQASGEGLTGSRALGIQAISTFDAQLYVDLSIMDMENPKIGFFAKTGKNGSGTRPVMMFVSFSLDGSNNFLYRTQIGNDQVFSNQNSEYEFYESIIPEEVVGENELLLQIEINYGAGSGSAARFYLDDFAVYSGEFPADPIGIKEATLLNPFAVQVLFDREISLPELNHVKIDGENIESILFPSDSTLVMGSQNLLEESQINILFERLESKSGGLTKNLTFQIHNDSILFSMIRIIQPDKIRLGFSQQFDPAQASQSGNFRVNGKSPKAISVVDNNYEIELSLQQDLILEEIVSVEIASIQNPAGKSSHLLQRSALYTDYIEEVLVKDARTIHVFHSIDVDIESILAEEIIIMDHDFSFQVSEIPDDPSGLTLMFDKDLEENLQYSLLFPERKSRRGIEIPGSIRSIVWDITPPELVSVTGLNAHELLLVFSEPIDPAFAMMTENYLLAENEIEKAIPQENPNHVLLLLNKGLINGISYLLEVNQIPDLAGNFIWASSYTFVFEDPDKLDFKTLIINEVMAAPREGNLLPNVEYIELLNTTEKTIPLAGITLSNSRSSTVLPVGILLPGEYVLLVPRNQVSQFLPYGSVLGVTNWPSLLNSGDQIKLLDKKGNIVDSLEYDASTYGSSTIASGGYSLEIVNPFFPCNPTNNLKPSTATAKGTPGKINSVYDITPDRTAPELLQAKIQGDTAVTLFFSEPLDPNLAIIKWIVSPNLKISHIQRGQELSSVNLVFEEKIQPGIKYSVQVENLRDCSGNIINRDQSQAYFLIPSPADAGDIIINELLFNPLTGSPKFVEIFNSSSKHINLKDWKLANYNASGEVANRKILLIDDFIMEPFGYLVFSTDGLRLKSDYPKGNESNFIELSSLPSFPISSGNVILLNPDESISEIFSYSEKMHHVLLKEKRGVSLERLNYRAATDNINNWHSASASEGFATPGYKNSQNYDGETEFGIFISPRVFAPDAAGEQNFTKISYNMKTSGNIAAIKIYSIDGQLIRNIVQNEIWGHSGFYTWDGTNEVRRKVRPGYYIIRIEIFDLHGNVDQINKTVVVATKF